MLFEKKRLKGAHSPLRDVASSDFNDQQEISPCSRPRENLPWMMHEEYKKCTITISTTYHKVLGLANWVFGEQILRSNFATTFFLYNPATHFYDTIQVSRLCLRDFGVNAQATVSRLRGRGLLAKRA